MRWIYLAVIVLFAGVTLIFAVQNFQSVTIAFLGFHLSLPMALMAIALYLLGMATGSSLWALLRRSFERAHQ